MILIAKTLKENEIQYRKLLKQHLSTGASFPQSSAFALKKISGKQINLPNDILGFQYVKTIVENKLDIEPICLKRTVDFHSDSIKGEFASASLLRSLIFELKDISMYSPMKFDSMPDRIENYYSLYQKIIKANSPEMISKVKLVSEGIENRLLKYIEEPSYYWYVNKVNSTRYTSSRIKRIMLNILLKFGEGKI